MRFDIRGELILLLGVNISIFLYNSLVIEGLCVLMILIVQCLASPRQAAWRVTGIYLALVLIQLYVLPGLPGLLRSVLSIPAVQFRKMFPLLMVLILMMRTIRVSEVLATMEKLRMPRGINVSLAVTLRYFPTMGEEWRGIREAMSVRRISARHANPIRWVGRIAQFYLAPMMISAARTVDELSAAALTRGIDQPGGRSCWKYRAMEIQDWLLIAGALLLTAGAALKRSGRL